jgi:hypothetical protein
MNNLDRKNMIESLINLDDPEIKTMYMRWDKGDCSEIGLCEILLAQLIREHKNENGVYYDTDYDEIKLRYKLDKPKRPLTRIITEGTSGTCPICGSTEIKRFIFFGMSIGCIQPKCQNYYKR